MSDLRPVRAVGAADWIVSPNIWWPDDRSWLVATEIDLNTTYIGCSNPCGAALEGASELEALAIEPATGIDWKSDTINPWPDE